MRRKSYLKTKSVLSGFLLNLLCLLSLSYAQSPDYSVRVEGCYLLQESGYGTFADNFFVATGVDYKIFGSDAWSFYFYTTPTVIYNPSKGLDVQVGVKLDFFGLSGTPNYSLMRGPEFPTNFLNDCGVYVRINIVEGYGGF